MMNPLLFNVRVLDMKGINKMWYVRHRETNTPQIQG